MGGAGLQRGDGTEAVSERFVVIGAEVTATQVNLNLRSLPGIGSDVIDVIPAGTTVPVLGHMPDERWLLVRYLGRRGWIAAWFTDIQGDLAEVPVEMP